MNRDKRHSVKFNKKLSEFSSFTAKFDFDVEPSKLSIG